MAVPREFALSTKQLRLVLLVEGGEGGIVSLNPHFSPTTTSASSKGVSWALGAAAYPVRYKQSDSKLIYGRVAVASYPHPIPSDISNLVENKAKVPPPSLSMPWNVSGVVWPED